MNIPLATIISAWAEPLSKVALQKAVMQLQVLAQSLAHDSAIRAALVAPTTSSDDKERLLSKSGFSTVVTQLVSYLDQHGLWHKIAQVVRLSEQFYQHNHGIIPAHVTSAVVLTSKERVALLKHLSSKLKRDIELTEAVEPSIIGGLIMDVQGQRHDHSVQGKLNRFARSVTLLA
ncbi:MAG: F0F1 ATP synthase subunit delta [bacterium]|nr:F0F1 ATP synthase subunit delta [bacterium]